MGMIRYPIRSRNKDAFHLRSLLEELPIQFVDLELIIGQRLGLLPGLQGETKKLKKEKGKKEILHEEKRSKVQRNTNFCC